MIQRTALAKYRMATTYCKYKKTQKSAGGVGRNATVHRYRFFARKKSLCSFNHPSHPPLRSRAAGSRRTRRVRMKQRTKETKARFRVRSLPGLLGGNGRQIRTQRGPMCGVIKIQNIQLRSCSLYSLELLLLLLGVRPVVGSPK